MKDVTVRVKKVIGDQLGIEESQITEKSDFMSDLGADSLDIVELVMAIEEEFDVDISDDDAEKFTTVQDVIDYLVEHV